MAVPPPPALSPPLSVGFINFDSIIITCIYFHRSQHTASNMYDTLYYHYENIGNV